MIFDDFLKRCQKRGVTQYNNTICAKPLVSISVVTFQHANYIKKCLDGILMQETNFLFEILLGEDDSKDGTREICIEYAEKFPDKIRLFLHHRENNIEINNTPTGRFNFIYNLYNSRGKYIALCEGDDYWTDPLKLQKQVDFLMANPDYGICFHNVEIFNQTKDKFLEDYITRVVPEITTIKDLALGNFIHTVSAVFRNDFVLPEWFTESPLGDWPLYMIVIKDRKIKKMQEVLAVYRVHDKSIWSHKPWEHQIKNTLESVELVLRIPWLNSQIKETLQSKIVKYNAPVRVESKLKKIKRFLKRIFNE